MKTAGQPGQQTGLRRGQIDTGHANLGKSQFAGPSLYMGYQLNAVERHVPIVGSADPRAGPVLVWTSEDDTRAFAQALALRAGVRSAFIELHGDLGAGKTTFVRHLLRALGVQGRIKSPTYAVVEPHEVAGMNIWHFDFYRFNDPREWEDAGFRDIFAADGLKLAEWPEKASGHIPLADLAITIEAMTDDTRHVTLKAQTPLGAGLLEGLPA
ncbi:MAG: tRNA (adenosine(37)-N6)-threonylcarbamoyltransferase complex ATPase subunit type 1 TsaE [Bdellovibrionales bacterium]|nr:tRNA (adenosine(37)-N6)-threonylcarbamoyltransferase complex ATPase subunit type 1 TsaE [Ramlibacter sp.]